MKQVFKDATSLDAIEAACWQQLTQATLDKDCGWRLPALGTVDSKGRCRQRTVVLRHTQAEQRLLQMHTDIRSTKIEQIRSQSEVSLLFYDHKAGVQLSITGNATLHTDDATADRMWKQQPEASLKGYLGEHAPGSVSDTCHPNLPERWGDALPDRHALSAARSNFCVVNVDVKSLEYLLLDRSGQRRAIFRYENDGTMAANWLMP